MLKRSLALVAAIAFLSAAHDANAQALTAAECMHLTDSQYLAAIERGSCRVDIVTAAGPDDDHTGKRGGSNNGGGSKTSGGGNKSGGGGSPAGKP